MVNRKRKEHDEGEPEPLNFDEDEGFDLSNHLRMHKLSPSDVRGDAEDDQYYEEQEAISPEEVEDREEEGTL
ncbi:MAG: hypothetical protein JSS30_02965 [Verrucomicrobia bacterium]|nr:hypothetical protein [Verrucomicrobiota bacterium]